jgi:pSer/pThr/pTyr-binding forkhead associated (FHA) protein
MLAHLVPCSGGKPIALTKPNLFLGRRQDTEAAAPLAHHTARCRLRLVAGWWEIDRLDPGTDLRINNRPCESGRVRPGDEVLIGRARYRMEYSSPEAESEIALQALSDPPGASAAVVPAREKASSREIPAVEPRGEPPDAPPRLTPRAQEAPTAPVLPALGGGRRPLAHLVPIGGGQDFAIFKAVITVGRDSSNDIALRVKTVSGLHCRLEFMDGYWRVFDMNSRNGVRVDGVPCREAWVFPESRLSIADQRFQLDYKPEGPRPMPDPEDPSRRQSLMAKIGLKDKDLDAILTRINEQYGPDESQSKRRDLTIDM